MNIRLPEQIKTIIQTLELQDVRLQSYWLELPVPKPQRFHHIQCLI